MFCLFIRRIPHFFTFQKYGHCVFTFHGKTSAQITMKLVFSEKVMYFENKMVVVQKPVLDRLWRYFVGFIFFIVLLNGA